jgi:hypothetical protein
MRLAPCRTDPSRWNQKYLVKPVALTLEGIISPRHSEDVYRERKLILSGLGNKILRFHWLVFRRKRRKEERGREITLRGCLFCIPCWELACNPGMYPGWESKHGCSVCRPTLNPLSYPSQAEVKWNFC